MTAKTIHVSSSAGNDAHPGTDVKPVKTLARGLSLAAALGDGATVKVTIGLFAGPVELPSGVELRGGFKPGFSQQIVLADGDLTARGHDPAKYKDHCTVIHGAGRVVIGSRLARPTTLRDLVIIADEVPASSADSSSYAIVVSADAPSADARLVLDGVKIVCADGARGAAGSSRKHADHDQYVGSPAKGGRPFVAAAPGTPVIAGAGSLPWASSPECYGHVGEPGADAVRDRVVLLKGGKGGAAGRGNRQYSFNGDNGEPGGDGEPGQTPTPGLAGGRASATTGGFDKDLRWVGGAGGSGVDGGDGSGGGAGGSGGTLCVEPLLLEWQQAIGGRGGDGGRGGNGGHGGGGGGGGGGSFGIVARNVRVVAPRASITLRTGGWGGNGGSGETGHAGEPGHPGESARTSSDGGSRHLTSGKGGDGKPGGAGARGGDGAGGNGGPAIAVVLLGAAVLDEDDQDLLISGGRPGQGGYGSVQGHTATIAEWMKVESI
ncbi:hypothetical protein OV203_50370 [Nannocystis sp. ILAH1]|uniref:hypothetical protein n=1 Tax=Nannocystis sp. ILAH1 TaxID=2996789 RepID=UPI00226DB31D|nr:hypothetical protein [Nannocystis sp. ILAH1]MCY0993124.1 hypothetical protein [Nannocystis sp. ILAH1]MCY0995432.1 hypothetical protein [Nannocystis sp. ILAH1]